MDFYKKVKVFDERQIFLFGKKIFSYIPKKYKSSMKLGISYNLFDGEELLETSIKSVRKSAYHISVVYQLISNSGEKRSDDIVSLLQDLKKRHLIDEFSLFETDATKPANVNERNKRLVGLKIARKAGCTHYLSLDVDEFYHYDEIEKAKLFIERKNIEASAVSIIEYVKKPEYKLVCNYMFSLDSEDYTFYVPFICKIKVPKKIQMSSYFPCLVDQTRILNGMGKFYLFPKHEISMHHMSTIRSDIEKKFRNSTISLVGDRERVEYFNGIKFEILNFDFDKDRQLPEDYSFIGRYPVQKVENVFDIRIEK